MNTFIIYIYFMLLFKLLYIHIHLCVHSWDTAVSLCVSVKRSPKSQFKPKAHTVNTALGEFSETLFL